MVTPRTLLPLALLLLALLPLGRGGEKAVPEGGGNDLQLPVSLAPRRQAVLSSEVFARVLAIHREFGQSFVAGAPLLKLDPAHYEQQRAKAAANVALAEAEWKAAQERFSAKPRLKKTEARHRLTKAQLATAKRLHADQSLSALDLAQAEEQRAAAAADLESARLDHAPALARSRRNLDIARADLAEAERELAACTIRAPYNGRVVRLLVQEQELVQRGQALLEVVSDGTLLAKFLVPAAHFQRLRQGQPVTLHIAELDRQTTAVVSHIASALDPASQTVEVHAEVRNEAGVLRSGMTGTVVLPQEPEPPPARVD